jgi:hypothetical protein
MRFWGVAAAVMLGLTAPAHAQAPQAPPALLSFTAYEGDIAFQYPETYEVEEVTEDFGGDPVRLIVLSDVSAEVPEFGEGPPTITIQIVKLPPNTRLDSWVRTNDASNFVFSLDGVLRPTMIGGQDARAYRYSGLYENDAVAVRGNGVVYLFSAGWIAEDDRIRADFQTLLESVRFNSP